MSDYKLSGTKESILDQFGYIILDKGQYWVATVKDDPEAFLVVCESKQEATEEAFNFLSDGAVDYEFIVQEQYIMTQSEHDLARRELGFPFNTKR